MATYTKLRSGAWGVRLDDENPRGAELTVIVRKKSGETKSECVTVLWSGKGISLARINPWSHDSEPATIRREIETAAGKRELAFVPGRGRSFRIELDGKLIGWVRRNPKRGSDSVLDTVDEWLSRFALDGGIAPNNGPTRERVFDLVAADIRRFDAIGAGQTVTDWSDPD